jgi:hypothetical protein
MLRRCLIGGAVVVWTLALGGCATERGTPMCGTPARLYGKYNSVVPTIFVGIEPGADLVAACRSLAEKYGPGHVAPSPSGHACAAALKPNLVPALRCEPNVEYVDFDAELTISSDEAPNKALERSRDG